MRIVFDTSALLSLAAGGILELAIGNFGTCIPRRVEEELRGISKKSTFEGNLAKRVLEYVAIEIEVIPTINMVNGEFACVELANDLEDSVLLSDDIAALEKLKRLCKREVLFSTTLLTALYWRKIITKERALSVLERIRVKRNWKNNAIFEQAYELFVEDHFF